MIFVYRAPKNLPAFSVLIDDQGKMHPAKMKVLSDYLGVSVQTFKRWLKSDDAPHAARMALWWVSRWGSQTIDAEIHVDRQRLSAQVRGLQEANANLQARVARLERLGEHGSANAPYFYPERMALFNSKGEAVTPLAVAVGL